VEDGVKSYGCEAFAGRVVVDVEVVCGFHFVCSAYVAESCVVLGVFVGDFASLNIGYIGGIELYLT
jgi:hypothetical protein